MPGVARLRCALALALGHPARADHEVRLARDDRLDESGHLRGIVLAVRIERHDDLDAQALRDEVAGLERRALAAVDRVADDVRPEGAGDLDGAVA